MGYIFLNKNNQVRSGWKILSVFVTFIIASILAQLVIILQSGQLFKISSSVEFICNIVQCLVMIFSVFIFWKVYDKKPISEIGFINIRKGSGDLIKGLLLGALSLITVFILLLCTNNIILANPLSKPNFNASLITGLILFIFVGIDEEMFARGYCMTVLKQTGNKFAVVIIPALIFSFMHSLNPGMSILSYINLFLFGLCTAYMFIRSGNLWLSIGYHIAWNYFEGNICGFLVSGTTASGLYNVRVPVNNIVNGGKFGPEGGLAVTFILILNFLYLWKFYRPSDTDI